MIQIQDDMWRADCIASVGHDFDELWIYPTGCSSRVSYTYRHSEEARAEHRRIVRLWAEDLHTLFTHGKES